MTLLEEKHMPAVIAQRDRVTPGGSANPVQPEAFRTVRGQRPQPRSINIGDRLSGPA